MLFEEFMGVHRSNMVAKLGPEPLAQLIGFFEVLLFELQVPAVVPFIHNGELEELLFFLQVDDERAVVGEGVADSLSIVGELVSEEYLLVFDEFVRDEVDDRYAVGSHDVVVELALVHPQDLLAFGDR